MSVNLNQIKISRSNLNVPMNSSKVVPSRITNFDWTYYLSGLDLIK